MKEIMLASSRIHLRTYLAAGYAAFIIYASLSPFSGWQEQGLEFLSVLSLPLWSQYTWFDAVANLLVYFPFGFFLGLTLRIRHGMGWSILLATMGGAILSFMMEYAQMYLPVRISSNLDLLTNICGTLAGALLAASIAPRMWFVVYLAYWRTRLFHNGKGVDFGVALVALWMFAQINPSLPILGNVFISEVVRAPFVVVQPEPFNWMESLAVLLNMLMLGMLLLTLLRIRRHAAGMLLLVMFLVIVAKFTAAAILLKSWALLLWLNGEAMLGILSGLLLLVVASRCSRMQLLKCAAAVTFGYWVLAYWILDSGEPAAAMRLYQWKYGHLLNYNGLSHTVILVFPFLMLCYLWRARSI